MFRGIVAVLLFSFSLFAYDYSMCAQKLRESFVSIDGHTAVAVSQDEAVMLSRIPPKITSAKLIKRDPFFGLYLFRYPHHKRTIAFQETVHKEMVAVYADSYKPNSIVSYPKGFSYGRMHPALEAEGVISDICYRVYALTTKDGFLDADRVNAFLSKNRIVYSGLGIDVVNASQGVSVKFSDPFFKGNPFLDGDVITKINGVPIRDKDDYFEQTMNLPVGSNVNVEIVRGSKVMHKTVTTRTMRGGGLVPWSFMGELGIQIDNKAIVKSLRHPKYGFEQLKLGDKIISINQIPVRGIADIKDALSKIRTNEMKFLIERDNFMFFITIDGQRRI